MRIVSGFHRGRKIQAPKKLPVRPTTDMAKEALFNILGNRYRFPLIAVCDLFAGTGNLSYEFGSRGVEEITAVDTDRGCTQFIEQTATKLELPITVVQADAYNYLEKCSQHFDVIVADPPYDFEVEELETLIELAIPLLKEDGVLILEHSKHKSLEGHTHLVESRRYGSTQFSFFKAAGEE